MRIKAVVKSWCRYSFIFDSWGPPTQGCRATKNLLSSLNFILSFPILSLAPQGRKITLGQILESAEREKLLFLGWGCEEGNLGPAAASGPFWSWSEFWDVVCSHLDFWSLQVFHFSFPIFSFLLSCLQSRCLFYPRRAPHQTNPSHGCYN